MQQLVTVADTMSLPEAYMMKARLEAEGFTCFLRGDRAASCVGVPSQLNLHWGNATAAIEVRVPTVEAAAAKAILRQIHEVDEPRVVSRGPRRPAQWAAAVYLAIVISVFLVLAISGGIGLALAAGIIGFLIFLSYKYKDRRFS